MASNANRDPLFHLQEFSVSGMEGLIVQAGDVFGVHFSEGASSGTVAQISSLGPLCCGLTPESLSVIYTAELYQEDLEGGISVSTASAGQQRAIALKPKYSPGESLLLVSHTSTSPF